QCKWSREDKDYEKMENTLTVCSTEPNSAQSYTCSGKLTGLLNSQENKFFFRCKDIFDNVNKDSTSLTIIGTQPLVIDEVSPNDETIKDSTSPVKVTLEARTSAGVNRGEASCYWKREGSNSAYILFSSTGTYAHSANVWIEPGNYSYLIRCRDSANNADTRKVSFVVETDTSAPSVVRAFREGSQLKIITNEESECVYSNSATIGCSYEFDQGLSMTVSSDSKTHSTSWDPNKNLYIKCQDDFGNQPLPQQCNIVVRPFEV
ncbi:MAG: hypothetical protein KKB79_00635, partial [Nanoarchaeota archaeon]|nr:hypothetical protein [Nanoarchaeota archaeon]